MALAVVLASTQVVLAEPLLKFPVDCELNETCFLQQLVDMDPGPGAADAVCGLASYDGHTGTDIRTPQMVDLATAGRVVAALEGTVRGVRNDSADRLIETDADRAAIAGEECGNGVVIDHADGWQTQYCHLAQGSVVVEAGQAIDTGQTLGAVGLSGLTQFPHLEFIVRRNGEVIDPFSGRAAGSGCASDLATQFSPLWDDMWMGVAAAVTTQFIGAGLSAARIDHDSLMHGDPLPLYAGADAVVGWGWAINVQAGDVFEMQITGPNGFAYQHTSEPVPRNQAAYSAFAGERVDVVAGTYTGTVRLLRDGEEVVEKQFVVGVE
ncbi:MAG: M23 family metallopeptidase [Devosiaceae bacterium]